MLFTPWRPPDLGYNPHGNGSDSGDSGGSWDTSVNEDEVDYSISSATLGFDWVEYPDDARNYALFINQRFYEDALEMENTLNQRIATMEAAILGAMEGKRLRASPAATGKVTTTFAELRAELAELFCEHRHLFTHN